MYHTSSTSAGSSRTVTYVRSFDMVLLLRNVESNRDFASGLLSGEA